jgi:acyl carrier protein
VLDSEAAGERAASMPDQLRAYLSARLPDYMVPVFFVPLDALPLNYNLKVDRNALPDLAMTRTSARNPPVTDTERAIARIWCELLHIEEVSLDDNFMLLGGDSLLAMEMIFLVQQELSYRLDGMNVLRESLLILATLVDGQAGSANVEKGLEHRTVGRDILPVSSFYFGADNSLYGLYGAAVQETRSPPVLICPPIGYEYSRCHFLLRTLAEKLAVTGIPSLRFDFFGSGDSLGQDVNASFGRWREDLQTALDELRSRSGSARVRVFCLRLTAILALQSLPRSIVDRWVFWDPVVDGSMYHRELRRMSHEKVDKLFLKRNLKRPRKLPDGEELVGTRFSAESIREMKALSLHAEGLAGLASARHVLSADYGDSEPGGSMLLGAAERLSGLEVATESCWYRSTRVTVAITNKDILGGIHAHLQAEDQ